MVNTKHGRSWLHRQYRARKPRSRSRPTFGLPPDAFSFSGSVSSLHAVPVAFAARGGEGGTSAILQKVAEAPATLPGWRSDRGLNRGSARPGVQQRVRKCVRQAKRRRDKGKSSRVSDYSNSHGQLRNLARFGKTPFQLFPRRSAVEAQTQNEANLSIISRSGRGASVLTMVKTALDDRPRGGFHKRRAKSMMDQGRKGHVVEGEGGPGGAGADGTGGTGGGGGDASLGKIEDMASREKRLRRELNKRAAKFSKGQPVSHVAKIADRKTKAHVRYAETLADTAATNAALHEKWLLPTTPGLVEAEGPMERTFRFQQGDIAGAVDVNAARKAFDLSLPTLGPYAVDFTPNGRDLLIGGGKGHVAVVRWGDYKLVTEIQVREKIRDVQFLHSGTCCCAFPKS